MSSSEDGNKDYDVGYGKPPKHTQWQKGQSGNPSGKKTKVESFIDKIKKVAMEELLVHKSGAPQAMSYLDAAIYALFAKAQSGNTQALKLLADLLGKDAAEAMQYELKPADLDSLETHAQWVAIIEKAQAEHDAHAGNGAMDGEEDLDGGRA